MNNSNGSEEENEQIFIYYTLLPSKCPMHLFLKIKHEPLIKVKVQDNTSSIHKLFTSVNIAKSLKKNSRL